MKPAKRPLTIEWDSSALIAATVAVLFVAACVAVPGFASLRNLTALFLSVALVGIAAVGMSFITIVGSVFSMSVASTVTGSTIVFASTLQYGPWTALAIAMSFGVVSGVVQGVLVGFFGTDPIITTISAAAIQLGIFQLTTGGLTIVGKGDASVLGVKLFGFIPIQVLFFFVVTALCWWIHRYTVAGRRITLVGLNRNAALVAGVRAWPYILTAFVISGTLAGLSGALLSSQSGQGNMTLGATFAVDPITAVVIGGVNVKGGIGTPLDAAIGALLVGLLSNALILMGLSYDAQLVVKGALVLLAVMVSGGAFKKMRRRVA